MSVYIPKDVHALHNFVVAMPKQSFKKVAQEYLSSRNVLFEEWLLAYPDFHMQQIMESKAWQNNGVLVSLLSAFKKNPSEVKKSIHIFEDILQSKEKIDSFAWQMRLIISILFKTYGNIAEFPENLKKDPVIHYFLKNRSKEVLDSYYVQQEVILCFLHPIWKQNIYYLNDKKLYEDFQKKKEFLEKVLSPEEYERLKSAVFMYETMNISLLKSLENTIPSETNEVDIIV